MNGLTRILVSNFVKRTWFVVFSAITAILVFGSFVVVTLWTLWLGPADILIPIKLVIPIGYIGILLHAVRGVKDRDMAGLTFATIEIGAIIATVFGFRTQIAVFYCNPTYVYLGESLGPEVSAVSGLALIAPLMFLIFAGLAIPLAIQYGQLRRPALQARRMVSFKIKRPPTTDELIARLERLRKTAEEARIR